MLRWRGNSSTGCPRYPWSSVFATPSSGTVSTIQNLASSDITSDAGVSAGRFSALLGLPRNDYVSSFAPLVEALIASGDFRISIAVPPPVAVSYPSPVEIYRCPFYEPRPLSPLRWLQFAIRRERAVRRAVR